MCNQLTSFVEQIMKKGNLNFLFPLTLRQTSNDINTSISFQMQNWWFWNRQTFLFTKGNMFLSCVLLENSSRLHEQKVTNQKQMSNANVYWYLLILTLTYIDKLTSLQWLFSFQLHTLNLYYWCWYYHKNA